MPPEPSFYCSPVQQESTEILQKQKILLGAKNDNKNNHIGACRALINVLFSLQQGFTVNGTVLHSEEGTVASAGPETAAGTGLEVPPRRARRGKRPDGQGCQELTPRRLRGNRRLQPGPRGGRRLPQAGSLAQTPPREGPPQIPAAEPGPESRAETAVRFLRLPRVSGACSRPGRGTPTFSRP